MSQQVRTLVAAALTFVGLATPALAQAPAQRLVDLEIAPPPCASTAAGCCSAAGTARPFASAPPATASCETCPFARSRSPSTPTPIPTPRASRRRGRLVFAREYGRKVVPYTKLLLAPRSRPSDRLAALPAKRCGAVDPPDCRAIEGSALAAMELSGRWVAQSWTYQPDSFPGFRQNEIRLTDVARTDTRQIAAMTTGLGGQTYLGPSIVSGRVTFFRACQGDPGGCSPADSGAIRYRIADRSYELAGRNEAWTAWAYDGAAAYHVPSALVCGEGPGSSSTDECGIYRHDDLPWRTVDKDRIR